MILFDKLINKLNCMAIQYEIIEHEKITCVDDGIKLLDFAQEKVLKTIGFTVENKYLFVVLQGCRKLDYKKLEKACGIKRKSLNMISSDVLENELGYQVGGLSPIHLDDRIDVIIDSQIQELDIVFCGIGLNTRTLKISSQDLIEASDATVSDLVK